MSDAGDAFRAAIEKGLFDKRLPAGVRRQVKPNPHITRLIAGINGPMAEREAEIQAGIDMGLSRDDATIRAILGRRPGGEVSS